MDDTHTTAPQQADDINAEYREALRRQAVLYPVPHDDEQIARFAAAGAGGTY